MVGNLAPLVRKISWSNNIVIMENAKMICRGNFTFKWQNVMAGQSVC